MYKKEWQFQMENQGKPHGGRVAFYQDIRSREEPFSQRERAKALKGEYWRRGMAASTMIPVFETGADWPKGVSGLPSPSRNSLILSPLNPRPPDPETRWRVLPGAHARTGCSGSRRHAPARTRCQPPGASGLRLGAAEARRPAAREAAAAGKDPGGSRRAASAR